MEDSLSYPGACTHKVVVLLSYSAEENSAGALMPSTLYCSRLNSAVYTVITIYVSSCITDISHMDAVQIMFST